MYKGDCVVLAGASGRLKLMLHTLTRNINPNTILAKGFFVAIKAFKAAISIAGAGSIHGCILLMSEDHTWARYTLTTGFRTLSTYYNATFRQLCFSTCG